MTINAGDRMGTGQWEGRCDVNEMCGKTLVAVTGMEKGSEQVTFDCADGSQYILEHIEDCCESVQVEDVTGNCDDLIGSPLTMSEEVTNADDPGKPSEWAESWTWTFYKFATVKGYVTLRWLGESNGYYGETAAFYRSKVPVTVA